MSNPAEQGPVAEREPIRILTVDDEASSLTTLRAVLAPLGCRIVKATSGEQALRVLLNEDFAVILLDIQMTGMDGFETATMIRTRERSMYTPIIFLTGSEKAQGRVFQGYAVGGVDYMFKPYDPDILRSKVKVFVDLARVNKKLELREKELARSNQVLSGLYRIAEGLNQAGSEREVAELALERALELPGIQAGWISLREGESGFRLAAAHNLPPALEAPGAMEGDCACRRRLLSGELHSVTNILECERLQKATGDTRGLLYHASVPLCLGDRTLGVMNLVGPEKGLFNEEELNVLHSVGNQFAVALERAHLHEHLEKVVEERTARIIRLNRIHAVLSGINTAIVRVQGRQQLFEQACRIAVEQGRFTFAWIGMLDAGTQEVTPVARAGHDDGYLSQIHLTARVDAPGNCELTARALAEAVPMVCNDIASDERVKTGRAEALERGYRSVALLPFFLEERPIGVFALYAPEPGVFDEEEMGLLVEMTGDITFALDHLRKRELLEQRTAALTVEIAERRRTEEQLRASEEKFRALVENSSDGIVLLDRDRKVFYASPAVTRILGYDVDEVIGGSAIELVHRDDLDLVHERFAVALATESVPVLTEVRYRHKDGSWRNLETVGTNRLNEPAVNAVVINYRDVTERLRSQEEHRRMEHRLEQAQRVESLGRAAATIAHEFNNVLMGIQPFAEVISRRAGGDERISKAAEQISNSVRRGKRVTDDILRFTRPIEPQLEVIDMGKWVAQIEPELRSVAGSSVQIAASVPGEPLFARCDAAQMQQVAANLVINARDAMPNGGTITLTLATSTREDNLLIGLGEDERFVHLSVRDNGSGIATEMLEQIFEPLFTTKRSGTGLGLAVARRVLTQHGGFIFAENEPGGGTAFHILLPRVDEALSTAVAVAAQKINGRIRRLLLVEDEVSVAAGLSSLLELEEIVVRVVGLGREVVPAIEEFAPDAVVLDLTLPDIDGREVFAQITARWPDLPVVFSTGHGSEVELAQELARDHIGFLRKPYEVAALMAAIESVL